jgi:hypothetical protein
VDHRRKGIGTQLAHAVIGAARGHFARLRLRTDNPIADAFYRSLGFMPVTGELACSHQLVEWDDPITQLEGPPITWCIVFPSVTESGSEECETRSS